MKSIQTEKKSNWKKINKVVLRVDSIDLHFDEKENIILYCGFENISRGRCNITIQRIVKKIPDTLYIHTDQPLMVVNIFYKIEKIEKLINFLGMNKNNKKKIRLELDISDNLMVNKDGYLYVKDKFELNINSISWNIPII